MGGYGERFFACGGEDGKIRVWHKNVEEPAAVLTGHLLTVNIVYWNPKYPKVLASGMYFELPLFEQNKIGSDDCTIKIWSTDDVIEKLKDQMIISKYIFSNMLYDWLSSGRRKIVNK